jgi:hypothetical protein
MIGMGQSDWMAGELSRVQVKGEELSGLDWRGREGKSPDGISMEGTGRELGGIQ